MIAGKKWIVKMSRRDNGMNNQKPKPLDSVRRYSHVFIKDNT